MHNLNFTCVACGRCCYGSFPATLDEALRLAADVPLVVGIIHSWGPSKNPSPAQGKAERRYLIHYITEDHRTVWLHPTVGTLNPHDQPCAFLTPDQLCRLQGETKPLRCRAMPLYRGTEPSKGVISAVIDKCPPEVHEGPPLVRYGRVVDPRYAAAASAELAEMERDLPVVGLALLYAARVFEEVENLINDSRRRSDLFAVSPAFLALSACAQGRWTLEHGAHFCEAQAPLLDEVSGGMVARDPGFASRVATFASATRVVGRDLRDGGGRAMQDWRAFQADADGA